MEIIWNFKEHRWSYVALFIFVIIGAFSVFFNLLAYNLALRDFTSTKIPEVLEIPEAIGAFIGGFLASLFIPFLVGYATSKIVRYAFHKAEDIKYFDDYWWRGFLVNIIISVGLLITIAVFRALS
ncbi:MAG: hypothetical protein WA102_02205 [Candidatus Methanoperedens sp.]